MTKLCVQPDGSGYLKVTGTPDTAQSCPYVVTESGNQVIELYPFNLTMEEGAAIAGAILSVWAVGFIINMIRKTMNA